MVAAPRVRYQSEPGTRVRPPHRRTRQNAGTTKPRRELVTDRPERCAQPAHRHRHRVAVMITCTVLGMQKRTLKGRLWPAARCLTTPVRLGERAPDILICAAARPPKLTPAAAPNGGCARKLRLAQVRVCCDTPQEASVVDVLASFGVVHADMPVTLADIWLAMQGPACSEGPAR